MTGERNFWTCKEHAIIEENYGLLGPKGVEKLLVGRTARAIREQARILGVQTGRGAALSECVDPDWPIPEAAPEPIRRLNSHSREPYGANPIRGSW